MAATRLHDGVEYSTRAGMLVRQLLNKHDPKYGVGSMTCSIYNTAWVSMVAKTTNGQTRWLFPSSFQYLLDHQQHDGGWQNSSSDIDGILNSLAALLALCRHIRQPRQIKGDLEDLVHQKSRAVYFLEAKFSSWAVDIAVTNPSVQPLVAKLLQMLESEGLQFCFPGRNLFLDGRESENPDYSQSVIYGDPKKAVTGFLEGRVGDIDFDRVGQHKISGSMMASPASTAAYLMNCSTWDDEAEAYLNHVVSLGVGQSTGGVPTKFPTTIFEVTSTITTLLENGFTHRDLGVKTLGKAVTYLEDFLRLESGVTGFAPYVESGADNTARAISTLRLLGQPTSQHSLIIQYGTRQYFNTYTQDRFPSFSTNCYALKALLDLPIGDSEQMSHIEKTVKFLCNCWWTTNGPIEDESNVSANYPIMLMVETFIRLIERWETGHIPVLDDLVIRDKVIISLFQASIRILQTQNPDGSWESGGCEVTAYAIISLTKLMSLSSASRVKIQVAQAIEGGRSFLSRSFTASISPDHVWKGKISPGSSFMYQAYVLAALNAPIRKQQTRPIIESHFDIPLAKMTIQTKYYARQAWFVGVPEWLVQACLIETHLFLPQIRNVRYAVFPSGSLVDDSYLESIPFAWIVANNLDNRFIGAEFVHQMTILTVLGRQLEDYMDKVVNEIFAGCLFEVEDIVYNIFQELAIEDKGRCFCDSNTNGTTRSSTATAISDVRSVLYRFISHVLNHPYVLMASSQDQAQLRSELFSFLICRVSQLSGEQGGKSSTDQTPHSYTFAFLACLVGKQKSTGGVGLSPDFLHNPEQQYLAADLCRHMSIISFMSANADERRAAPVQPTPTIFESIRLGSQHAPSRSISPTSTSTSSYDDSYSSISPSSSVSSAPNGSPSETLFHKPPSHQAILSPTDPSQETLQMTRLLKHERRCLNLCFEGLIEAGINHPTMNIIKLFVDFNDLSEQIYRDPNIGSTYQPSNAHELIDQACILNPPPVPPKRRRGSVAAARAALTVEPLETKRLYEQDSRIQRSVENHEWTKALAQTDRTASPISSERDWSWNKQPSIPRRRTSRASSEVSRIESIMSEIDGLKLRTGSKPGSQTQRRTASESDAAWAELAPKIDVQRRLTDITSPDAEAIKLAKARLETQRRNAKNLRNKTIKQTALQRKLDITSQTQITEDINKSNVKSKATCPPESAGWIKAPQPESLESVEARSRRLHRASRLGGPKWKAPF